MKIGTKLKCIDTSWSFALTLGKVYTYQGEEHYPPADGPFYLITDDDGDLMGYYHDRFKVVQ